MVRRYYNLPSLTQLAVFEAAARHMSFKLAAAELNVTPSAVSRQVKALEEEAGSPLFRREMHAVQLTSEGETLYAVLTRAFGEASETFERIRKGAAQDAVTLACTTAMATQWLMRHIGAFWRAHPEIEVNHLISDNARDYRRAEVDLRIRYGYGVWPDESAHLLFEEEIYPVCGIGFHAAHEGAAPADLPDLALLHVEGVDPIWTNWEEFLRRADIPHGPITGRRFNNFTVLLQAAQDDQGVALGWHALIEPLIAAGRLTALTELRIRAPGAYYLTWNDSRPLSPAAETLKTWLLDVTSAMRAGAA
jgi:DNA-binding transcriptional LysR family regulator